MEENVALDSNKQKKFVKSIKGIKKLIKKNAEQTDPKKDVISTPADEEAKPIKKRKFPRGLVYLSHIPHGFYEHEMTQYFKQFGVVTNARVIRSKRTGRSKGFAFVEFKQPAVAQIVAETMNNYLMGKRLIKAVYIPPEKQKRNALRKRWNDINNPGSIARMEIKKNFNADKDELGELKRARKLLSNLNKTKKKLSAININYDFFTPVDIPEELLKTMVKEEQDDGDEPSDTKDKVIKVKKDKKAKKEVIKKEKSTDSDLNKKDNESKKKVQPKKVVNVEKDTEVKKVDEKSKLKNIEIKKEPKKDNIKLEKNAKSQAKNKILANKKEQKEKENKLKDAGVKPMGDFVRINQESDDESDSSVDFDSDEYDKALENDDEFDSEDDSDAEYGSEGDLDVVEEESDCDESSEIIPPVKKGKGKPLKQQQVQKPLKTNPQQEQIKTVKNKKSQRQQQQNNMKRKAPPTPIVSTKKVKFEKQNNQKQVKKQFKKKK